MAFFVRRMLIRHFLDWGSSFFNFSPHFIKNRFDGAKKRMISEFAVTIFSDWIYTLWHKRLITCFTFCHHPWEKGQRRACFSALVFLLGLDYDGKLKKATRKTAISIPEIRVEISFRPKFASSSSRFWEINNIFPIPGHYALDSSSSTQPSSCCWYRWWKK